MADRMRPAKPRILVVEDEILLALTMAQDLEEAGFEVIGPASTVASALKLVSDSGCDAAVLDINLTRETVEPVAHALRDLRVPFMTVTGYSKSQRPAVFDGSPTLSKPAEAREVVALLQQMLTSND
jgi:DNA-binding response OmpR family regulator